MKLKKVIALMMAAALCLALLAGCGGTPASSSAPAASTPAQSASAADSTPAAADEEVTITLATWDYTSNDSVKNGVEAFQNANPNIKVEVLDIPSADYNTKLNTMLNGHSDLDVYFIKDASSTYDLYTKGQLLDLTDLIARDNIDMSVYNGTDTPFNIEGKQFGMPARTDYYVLFYNKDLFDAAGVDYPTNDMTWDDFEALAMKMSGDGVYGAHFHTWQACVENWGVQDGKNTIMDYETGYDFFKPYYEMVLRLQDAGAIQDFGELQSGNIHYSGAFAAGNVAMMPMGTWYMATIINAINNGEANVKEWGVVTLPHPSDVSAGYTVGATTPLVINPESAKQEAAWEFIKFMTGEEGAVGYAVTGSLPGRINDDVLAEIAAMDGMPEGVAEALKVTSIVPDRPIVANVTEVNTMLGQVHQLIMLKECTIDEGLAQMAEQAEELVS